MNFGPPSDEIQPTKVNTNVRFSSIGGLKEHIKCLKEMIIFPLMYPELFAKFNTRPAKGVLFHGPPGTGKTLLARALANECSLVGGKKVAFFMRKGADVMNKFYGESEKNLRMLFQQARKMKPSIIFFDEIDALAPSRKPTEDSMHSSVVATLLSEMDGLCDRGDVIVIGATNRPDAMDPAVRRTGRLDRELYFPPPELEERRDILVIYTKDWDPQLSQETLDQVAKATVGYLGSDIKALCSEAVVKAVKRVYPQIYECDYKLMINTQNVEIITEDLLKAMEEMVPAGSRYMPQAARPLPVHCVPLLQDQLQAASQLLHRAYSPTFVNKPGNEAATAPSVFLVSGECAETHIAPALLAQLEHCVVKELSVSTLHAVTMYSPEQAVISLFADCRRTGRPCVIFVRDLLAIWETLARQHGVTVFLQLWRLRSVGDYTLLLATCNLTYDQLPSELKEVFPIYKDCIYCMRKPTLKEVTDFLAPVIQELPLVPPIIFNKTPHPPLPRAPIGPAENEDDAIRRLFHEYDDLRVLRTALRNICRGLSSDRRYQKFTTPLTVAANPSYFEVVKRPIDLSTVMGKIDNREYLCAKEFLDDIDLICANTFEYSRVKPDKKGRHEACALHKDAYNMVAEEVDAQLELECQLIAKRRREQGDTDHDGVDSIADIIYYANLSSFNLGSQSNDNNSWRPNTSRKRTSDTHDKMDSSKRFKSTAKAIKSISKNNKGKPGGKKSVKFSDEEQGNSSSDGADFPVLNSVLIDKSELDFILKSYNNSLCALGLETLIDLHGELSKTVYARAGERDRRTLPHELRGIVNRYVTLAHK